MKKFLFYIVLFTSILGNSQELLLHYPFDGNTNDISGNNYNGNPIGITYVNDRNGNPNSAAYFDGLDDYIELPNLNELKPNLPLSISFWIRYDSNDFTDRAIFNTSFEEDYNTGVFFTSQSSTGKYATGFGDGSFNYTSSSRRSYVSNNIIDINEWRQILIVVESATSMKIYEGCTELSGDYSGSGGSLSYSSLPGVIGKHDQNVSQMAYFFKGAIDDFKYYKGIVSPELFANTSFTNLESTICVGESYTLPTTSSNGISGSWSPTFDSSSVGTGVYTFTPDANQCATIFTHIITVKSVIIPNFINLPTEINIGDMYVLPIISNNGVSGSWTPPFSSNTIGITNYIFIPDNFCASKYTHSLKIIEHEDLIIPLFFSPNGDNTNDLWVVKGLTNYKDVRIIIFDRYGNPLKEVNPLIGWDGKYNDKDMPSNDYWYLLSAVNINNQLITRKGHFSLLRK